MLNSIVDFFKKQKVYGVLFVMLIAVYGFFILTKKKNIEEPPQRSLVLEQYKKAEDKVQSKVKNMGSLESYLKDRPTVSAAVNIFALVLVAAFGAGLVLDYLIIAKPAFRESFRVLRPPPGVHWGFSLLFKFFIWFFAINIVISLALGVFARLSGLGDNFFLLFHTLCAEIVSFLVIFYLVKANGGHPRDIGFCAPQGKWFREIRVGWTAYAAILPLFGFILGALLVVTEIFHYEPPPHPLVPIFLEEGGRNQSVMFLSIALAVFLGPLFEEIFFRGFLYPILRRYFGVTAAIVVTSSLFAFVHDSTFAFWPIFVLGMTLNYIYEKRGSLIANITLHITHNALFLAYFFLAKAIVSREMGI